MTALLLPMMTKAGHDTARSGGLIAACGVIGPVIPPSIGFVIFGVAGNVSISKLFLAGIFPGILMGASLWLTWMVLVRKEKSSRRRASRCARCWRPRAKPLGRCFLPVIILVGLQLRRLHADRSRGGRSGLRLHRRHRSSTAS